MRAVLLAIEQALASYAARHQARPVAVYLGKRKLTQLIPDVALLGTTAFLTTGTGRPRTYRNLELLRDEVNVDALRVI